MASLFSKIVSGEIPCHRIAENDDFLAFLDIMPLAEGHVLVIPKKEVDYFFDLEDQTLSSINLFARDVARQMKRAIRCKRIGVAIIGLEVPHAHMHLIPLQTVADINFEQPKMQVTHEELASMAQKILSA